MFTITTTRTPATDLGYILHKHPDRIQSFDFTYGKAHIFYPVANPDQCTLTMIVDIDPMKIVGRGSSRQLPEQALQDYVNDRPYAATSHLTSAMMDLFSTAISGRCNDRPELPDTVMPLVATVASLPCRRSDELIHRFFGPLGYDIAAEPIPLDDQFPEWGMSRFYNLTLRADTTVQLMLKHLCALIPVLDNTKHYNIGEDEIRKFMRLAEGWIETHPEREIIIRRYLRHRYRLVEKANAVVQELINNLPEEAETTDGDEETEANGNENKRREPTEDDIEKPMRLSDMRTAAVMEALHNASATTVADLGCGEGHLLHQLLEEPRFKKILGTDVSKFALNGAAKRIKTRNMTPDERQRIELIQSSLIYRDPRIHDFDAAVAMEVIEHLDPPKVGAFTQVVLGEARPKTLVVTTPNVEYNQLFAIIRSSGLRHRDHRFEWTREEFRQWAESAAEVHGYGVVLSGIGNVDEQHGQPTQMAVFTRSTPHEEKKEANHP